jgi:menaquinone-dependent protoporphyrinogen oxidase
MKKAMHHKTESEVLMEIKEKGWLDVSRREMLIFSAGLFTAVMLGNVPGAGVSHAAEIKFAEGKCTGRMNKKILIAYASKYGSTGGVADAIGKELCARGVSADVALIKNVKNIGSYQGVVVGSAIYMGKWMSEAMDFVKKNKDVLRRMPVAYFLVCMTLSKPTEKNRTEVLAYMDPILKEAPELKPVGLGTFAGAMHYENLSWIYKKILKSKGTPEGDYRDWNAIRAWAREPVHKKFVG